MITTHDNSTGKGREGAVVGRVMDFSLVLLGQGKEVVMVVVVAAVSVVGASQLVGRNTNGRARNRPANLSRRESVCWANFCAGK